MATPIPINQCEFTLAEVVEATGGTLVRGTSSAARASIRGVSIDTRSLEPGALFVALRARRPTVTTIFHKPPRAAPWPRSSRPATVILLSIASRLTTRSPHWAASRDAISRARAQARALPLIAIGGAVGKTTTKELTAAVVRALFRRHALRRRAI